MNYTIGGNVSMSNWIRYYNRESNLVSLRNMVGKYVEECLFDHAIGETDLTHSVTRNLSEEIYVDVCRIFENSGAEPAKVLGDNTFEGSEFTKFHYKKSNFNLNLLGNRVKIKVWIGLPSRVSRENLLFAKEKYPEYHDEFFLRSIERDIYRIELYRLVRGFTFDDIIKKEPKGYWYGIENSRLEDVKQDIIHKFIHSTGETCIMNSMIETYFTYVSTKMYSTRYGINVYYPNDCNPGNFVLSYDSREPFPHNIQNIDHDHMIITEPKQMLQNITWQFFSRIFDIESLPDEVLLPEVVKWRKKHDLLEVIENFKMRFFKLAELEYDSEVERFEYYISKTSLNNSSYIHEYLNKKIKENKGDSIDLE
jgi:hypothetical protein